MNLFDKSEFEIFNRILAMAFYDMLVYWLARNLYGFIITELSDFRKKRFSQKVGSAIDICDFACYNK